MLEEAQTKYNLDSDQPSLRGALRSATVTVSFLSFLESFKSICTGPSLKDLASNKSLSMCVKEKESWIQYTGHHVIFF